MSLKEISKKIEKVLSRIEEKSGIEIEAKIKDVTNSDFKMIKDFLASKYPSENSFSIDYFDEENNRTTQLNDKFYNTSKSSILHDKIYIGKTFVKFSVSKEENNPVNIKNIDSYKLKREKSRVTYFDENLRYDLTEVKSYPSGDISQEMEIEVIKPERYNPLLFTNSIKKIIDFIDSYKKDIIKFCNVSLSDGKDDSYDEIKYYLISRPRDLKKKDLTSVNSILRNFKVSVKADGVQYFLLFHKSGIWLISNTKDHIRLCGLVEEFKDLENSMFAGEVLNKEKIKPGHILSSKCIFIPFDTISYKSKSVVNKTYTERISYFKDIVSKYVCCDGARQLQIIEKKIFDLGKTSKSFYKGFKECFENKKEIFYEDDGYIFTPDDSPYLAEGQYKHKRDRTLDKHYDVCKFKNVEKRSLDFKVSKGKIYYKSDRGLNPFKEANYNLDFEESLEDNIVEFFPHFQSSGEVIMKPSRLRADKKWPNTKDVVYEIFYSYFENNPITEETLLGKDTTLMRDFNNKVKKDLIDDISGYVVDIGAGKGGDMHKFGRNSTIKKVLSVEPNLEFSKEFEERLIESQWGEKFTLLSNTKGEDSEIISKGLSNFLPPDMKREKLTVTFMISLSFFWSSPDNLNSLARTLTEIKDIYKAKGGDREVEVVFLTIDGDKVEKMFSKYGKDCIQLNTIEMCLGEENQVMVNIEDSKTVSNQIEYLVRLNQLFEKAGLEKIYLKEIEIDKKLLMSSGERIYASLFVYGKYKLSKKPNFSYTLPRIEINVKKGIESDGRILAKGDDSIKPITFIEENICRVGTMDLNMSLSNSISKLTNKKYRDGDVHERIKIAKNLHSKIKNKDMGSVSDIIDYGIKIFHGKDSNKFGEGKDKWIILNKCSDDTYEPIVYITDSIHYTFSEDSFLLLD